MGFAQVQNAYTGTFGTSATTSYTSATTLGHLLVALAACTTLATVTGPSGWTMAASTTDTGSPGHAVFCWYKIADGTETSVSISASSNASLDFEIFEYSGNAPSGVFDTSVSAVAGSFSSGPLSTGSVTTAVSGEVLLVVMGQIGNAPTWGNTWTNGFARSNVRNTIYESATLIAGAAGSYSTQESWSGTDRTISLLVAFKPAVDAGRVPDRPNRQPQRGLPRLSVRARPVPLLLQPPPPPPPPPAPLSAPAAARRRRPTVIPPWPQQTPPPQVSKRLRQAPVVRRGHVSTVVPAQVPVPKWPPTPLTQTRRVRGWLRARSQRTAMPLGAAPVPDPPERHRTQAVVAPQRRRRVEPLVQQLGVAPKIDSVGRRTKILAPPWPRPRRSLVLDQPSVAAKPPRRPTALTARRGRAVVAPWPQALPPNPPIVLNPTQQRRVLRGWLSARTRIDGAAPAAQPDAPPAGPHRPAGSVRSGTTGTRPRRTSLPADQPTPLSTLARRVLRGLRSGRGHRVDPPWPQQTVPPVNPPIVFAPSQRRALRGWLSARTRTGAVPAPQQTPPTPNPRRTVRSASPGLPAAHTRRTGMPAGQDPAQTPASKHRLLFVLRRPGRVVQPPWPQATPPPPANPPIAFDRRRPRTLWAAPQRRRFAPPVADQPTPPPTPTKRRAWPLTWRPHPTPPVTPPTQPTPPSAPAAARRQRPATTRRARPVIPPWPQQNPPVNPPIVLRPSRLRRAVAWVIRGRLPWIPSTPPTPVVPTVYLTVQNRVTGVAAGERPGPDLTVR